VGLHEFRTVKPSGYPIPVNGPVGQLIRAQNRHNLRLAHIHFMIHKAGYKTQFSQLFSADDPHLETDLQFAVTAALIGHYEAHDNNERVPDADVMRRRYSLQHRVVVMPGEAALPMPPITGKVEGKGRRWSCWKGGTRRVILRGVPSRPRDAPILSLDVATPNPFQFGRKKRSAISHNHSVRHITVGKIRFE
jgi:hypothetical protein